MYIKRVNDYISMEKLPKEKFILIRLFCKHSYIDNILVSKSGFSRLNGEDHIVYCEKCGYIKGMYSK